MLVLNPDWRLVIAEQTFIGARQIALKVEALAIELCPVASNGGGALKKAHFMNETLDPVLGWRFQIGANTSYAYFVHQGTNPHEISAPGSGPGSKGASALYFNWPKAGGYVFFVSVSHPGTKPQPWLWKSANTIVRSSLI